jgi:hypothetical protein
MLTWEENIDAQVLRKRNWTISAIARHLGRDRKTIRTYLAGDRTPGQCTPAGPDGLAVFTDYVAARLGLDNISMAVRAAAAVVDRQRGAALNIVVPDSCHFLGFWSSGWCFAWSAGCWGGPLTH